MSHIAYVNGRYEPHAKASVHIEDRGYQFADGIYEYMVFFNRKLVDEALHLDRLERSLRELSIAMPMPRKALELVIAELIARNAREDGGLYMQITRGVSKRDHPFPKAVKPALTMTIWGSKAPKKAEIENGAKAITTADLRWARCDVKSISLLPNILAKQQAAAAGVREAFLFDGEWMTEGSVSNTFIVKNGTIITHPADHEVLPGVTRNVALKLARELQIKVEERPFSVKETFEADEVFLTSTSANVMPVTLLDGKQIGGGTPGEITKKLLREYHEHIFKQTGKRL